jgi:hypothetical protein
MKKVIVPFLLLTLMAFTVFASLSAAAGFAVQSAPPAITAVEPLPSSHDLYQLTGDFKPGVKITGTDFLTTGTINGEVTDNAPNVTSVFAVEVGNPTNVVQAAVFVVESRTAIAAVFNFGSANTCKAFRIVLNGPHGASTQDAQIMVQCLSSPQRIALLSDNVMAMVVSGVLTAKQSKPLTKRLNKAKAKLEAGKNAQAIEQLTLFVSIVDEYVQNSTLTPAEGQTLIGNANSIITQLSQ